jgi:hypothetical protein
VVVVLDLWDIGGHRYHRHSVGDVETVIFLWDIGGHRYHRHSVGDVETVILLCIRSLIDNSLFGAIGRHIGVIKHSFILPDL